MLLIGCGATQAGIWQVYRVLHFRDLDPATGKEHERTLIFSKRFVNQSMKKSFVEECCDPFYIEKLADDQQRQLDEFIAKNSELFARFKAYKPKDIDCVYNARVSLPKGRPIGDVSSSIPTDRMFKTVEIESLLTKLSLWDLERGFSTAQFVSPNHTCHDGYLVYRFSRMY